MEINNIPTPITPSRYSYSPTGSFKFWCQKVLPTVYDDSLSYYEILCKVVNYLNEVIKNVDGLNEDITTMYSSFDELQSNLITAYAELEGYVNTYFDNLDVQNEINEKLDAMARTGALTALISPFIPSLVTAWLDQHVVPTSPAIDKTLSIADAGADAKVVGDRIREDEIDIVRTITYSGLGYSPFNTRYINGNIDNEGHVTTTNDITNHVITSRATTSSRIVTLNADSGYQFRVFGYDSSDNYTGEMTDGWTTSYTFPANSSFRLLIAMSPDSANNKLYPTMAMSRVRYRSGIGYDVDELKISAELTNDINENYKYETYRLGQGYVSFYTNYVNGNIDSNGAVTVSTPLTRVVTSLMHIETRDVPVTSYNNIVFRVFEYTSADSFVREKTSGWTNSYTIPKNLYFRLLISRNPEGTATLTPNTAKSHVIYPDTIATRISTLESDETRFKNCMVSRFPRKKVSIIGDSIETWDEEGYKIDGYRMYYPNNDMDLHDVSDTWWYKVIVASGSLLEVNASYSGSRVTKTAPNPDYPDLWERISVIGNPNLVYIALGTNDSAGNVALGEYDFTSSIDSLSRTQFRPALIKGIKGIYQTFPQTTIVYIIERMADEYKESIKYICLQLGVKYVDVSSYYGGGVHPPVRGMREIASMVLTKTDDELLQSGFPADAKIVGEQISKTNANVIDIDNNYKYETYRLGQGYSSIYASYTNGDIDSNGVVTEGTPVTRVVSSLVSYSGRDIPLSASDGYQIRVFSYDSQGTFKGELTSGNWYQSFTIPNGTYFRLLIRRNPEGTTRLAPDTAKSHVTYLSTFAVSIQENKTNITDIDNNYKYETYKLGQGYASVYATYTNGDIDANGSATVGSPITRVISSITRYTGRDLELNCENGYQFRVFSYTEQNAFIEEITSGWSQSCVVPNGTYFRMLISRNPEGTAKLAPNTAKSHVVFLTTLASKTENNTNDITELKADLNQIIINNTVIPTWHQGYINTSTGATGSDPNYCYCDYIEATGFTYKITGVAGYNVKVVLYNASKVFDSITVALTSNLPVTFRPDEGTFFRIQYGLGNAATTPSDITDDVFGLTYASFTDPSLTMPGKSADAKVVGNAVKDVGGITFNLSQGYYNSSGVIVDNANYHHTDVLTENFVRNDFTITPNSVVVWKNDVPTFMYWAQISQLTTFDSIAYNFQTPLSSVVCITPSYLSTKVSSLDEDAKIEKTKTGQEFTLTQGYYNSSGIYVDNANYGCTAKLYETNIRRGFIPTPNSVVAWNNGTPIHRYWADVDQITTFDTIVYNFQTTDRKAYDLTPSYLSRMVDKLVAYASGTMDFAGKKVAIIGDSISTNGDYSEENPYGNVPEIIIETADVGVTLQAYPTYYDIGVTVGGHEITLSDVGSELTFTPTDSDVGKMVGKPLSYNPASSIVWWEIVQQELGIIPIPVCWSGASITSHNNEENNLKTSHAWHDATIRKCGIRTPGTMNRTAPDIILIYRGTNDFSHVPYTKITPNYYDSVPWRYPDTDVISDGYGYLQGLCLTVKKLREAYPMAVIILCTLNTFKRVDDSLFAIDNDRSTLPQYSKAIRDTADFLGCSVIEFDKDGITYENCYIGGYITDSEAHPTHPSDKGHKAMGNKAVLDLVTRCNSMV